MIQWGYVDHNEIEVILNQPQLSTCAKILFKVLWIRNLAYKYNFVYNIGSYR